MRPLALLFLVAGSVFGQFENLSTDDDGSVIYFSTWLRLKGSSANPWPKLYRLDGNGLHLAAQANKASHSTLETGGWRVESASLSGNGQVIAINSRSSCMLGNACVNIPQEFTELHVRFGTGRFLGISEVSRDGRYLLIWRETGFGTMPGPEQSRERGINRLNLATGVRESLGAPPARSGRWLASDGTALNAEWNAIRPTGESIAFGPPAEQPAFASLAPDAAYIVYQRTAGLAELRMRRPGGSDTRIADLALFPTISADARTILFLAPAAGVLQAFLTDGATAPRQVSSVPSGLREATLTGVTNLLAGVTGDGRLITIDLRNGFESEYTGSTPRPDPPPSALLAGPPAQFPPQSPGSQYAISGENFAPGAKPEVLVNGTPVPVLAYAPSRVAYQIPWETPPSPANTPAEIVLRVEQSPFEVVRDINSIAAIAPEFLLLATDAGARALRAIHGDWHGLVTPADPAVPGEIVHLYATGLGSVEPFVPTGTQSPANPPATANWRCGWSAEFLNEPARPQFVGLAPGLVGIYQVSVPLPATIPPQPRFNGVNLQCDNAAGAAWVPVN